MILTFEEAEELESLEDLHALCEMMRAFRQSNPSCVRGAISLLTPPIPLAALRQSTPTSRTCSSSSFRRTSLPESWACSSVRSDPAATRSLLLISFLPLR